MDAKLENEINEKSKEARSLIAKHRFPLSYFYTYDPLGAGDLFMQIGDIYLSQNLFLQASQEYLNAADAYKLSKDDIAKSYVAQSYNKAADVFSCKDLYVPNKAVECYILASDYYAYKGNFSLAASRRNNACDILIKESEYKCAADILQVVNEMYEKAKMPANRNINLERYLNCLLKAKKYTLAGEICMEMATEKGRESAANFYLMIAYFCFFVEGREEEKKEVVNIIEGEEKDIIISMQATTGDATFDENILKYQKICKMREEISGLIEDVKKMNAPEYNIL
ncbi:vesicular-fusion protein S17 [Binucleata daphniae]